MSLSRLKACVLGTSVFILIASSFPARAASPAGDGTGLQTSIAVDMVGAMKAAKDSTANDRFDVREAEMNFSAPIDHLFDGVLSFAAHKEEGASVAELHEASISTTKLVPMSRIKVGQFFLGIGRLNQIHRHDWPFIAAPKVHEEFFGDEAALDTGAEYALLLPLPFFLEATVGVTDGWIYGHPETEGKKPRRPTHYGRMMSYWDLPGDGGLQVGLNGLNRKADDGENMTLYGTDFTAKWRGTNYLTFLFQGEIWHRTQTFLVGSATENTGAYLYPQYGFSPNLQLGLRLDYFTVNNLKAADGSLAKNADMAYVPTLTYKPSEFSTFRMAYNYKVNELQGKTQQIDRSVELQTTFIIGAHPAHAF